MKEQSDIEFESLLRSVIVSPEEKSQLELIGSKIRIRIASVLRAMIASRIVTNCGMRDQNSDDNRFSSLPDCVATKPNASAADGGGDVGKDMSWD